MNDNECVIAGVAVLCLLIGTAVGVHCMIDKYETRMSICDSNNFTYQKCGELYGWDLK